MAIGKFSLRFSSRQKKPSLNERDKKIYGFSISSISASLTDQFQAFR